MWLFGTCDLNRDSVIQILNHWVPLKKIMFGTRFLSEDWNPNLNFMWVLCQIWVHPLACFWIQARFKFGLNSCEFQFITIIGLLLFLAVLQKFAFGLLDFEQWELEPRFPIRKFSNNPNKIVIFMSQTELEKKKNFQWNGSVKIYQGCVMSLWTLN